jgi:hypothetical protein
MIYVKGYMIRHQKAGILTDRVYLTLPSRKEFASRVANLGEGWIKVVETTLVFPDTVSGFASSLEQIPDPSATASAWAPAATGGEGSNVGIGELATRATGVVTYPK